MAFISKAQRELNFSLNTGTNNNICPGAYDIEPDKKCNLNKVPFGNASKRVTGYKNEGIEAQERDMVNCNNLQFENENQLIKQYLRKKIPNSSFSSVVKRNFIPSMTKSPGPG